MKCALCQLPDRGGLLRRSGLDLCTACLSRDPTKALAARGIPAEWDTALLRFSAGLGIPGLDPTFTLSCTPEHLGHKVVKLLSHEVQVGDPVFDDRIYVRTSDPVRAEAFLSREGVQSALLALLGDVRANDLGGNTVSLEGPTLTVGVRPNGGLPPVRVTDLQIETAALALHLLAWGSEAA